MKKLLIMSVFVPVLASAGTGGALVKTIARGGIRAFKASADDAAGAGARGLTAAVKKQGAAVAGSTHDQVTVDLWKALWTQEAVDDKFVMDAIANGANVNAKGRGDISILLSSVHRGHKNATKMLLEAGADPNVEDGFRTTPLMSAAHRGDAETIKMLVDAGADVNAIGSADRSALFFAVFGGHIDATRALVDAGADVNAKGAEYELTPLILARRWNHTEIEKILIDAGADQNATLSTSKSVTKDADGNVRVQSWDDFFTDQQDGATKEAQSLKGDDEFESAYIPVIQIKKPAKKNDSAAIALGPSTSEEAKKRPLIALGPGFFDEAASGPASKFMKQQELREKVDVVGSYDAQKALDDATEAPRGTEQKSDDPFEHAFVADSSQKEAQSLNDGGDHLLLGRYDGDIEKKERRLYRAPTFEEIDKSKK